jgi:hypothetical protein
MWVGFKGLEGGLSYGNIFLKPKKINPMNKVQAMARIMVLLNENGLLKPGSRVYKAVRKMASDKIDRLGPDAALLQIMDRKNHVLDQIRMLNIWYKVAGGQPPPDYW